MVLLYVVVLFGMFSMSVFSMMRMVVFYLCHCESLTDHNSTLFSQTNLNYHFTLNNTMLVYRTTR